MITPLLGSPLDHRLNILCGETFDLMAHRAAQPVAGKPPERELDGGNTAMNFRIRSLGL